MAIQERLQEAQHDSRQYNKRQVEEMRQRDKSYYVDQLFFARRKQSQLFDELAEKGVVDMIQDLTGASLFRPTLADRLMGRRELKATNRTLDDSASDWSVSYPLPTLDEMREDDVRCKIILRKPVAEDELPFSQYDEVAISYGGKLPTLNIAGAWSEYPPVDVFTGPDEIAKAIETAVNRAFDFTNRVPRP